MASQPLTAFTCTYLNYGSDDLSPTADVNTRWRVGISCNCVASKKRGIKRRDRYEETPKDEGSGELMRWAGHIQRTSEERLTGAWREEAGRRRRARPNLRWRHIVKSDPERTE